MLNSISGVISKVATPLGFLDVWQVRDKPAATKPGTIAKPTMRRMLQTQMRRNLAVGVCLSVAGGLLFKTFVADTRKKAYADFYRNYDADAAFEEMRKKGLFQSC